MYGAMGGRATCAGGAAVSQYAFWTTRVASGVGSGCDGVAVAAGVGACVGADVGSGVGGTGVGARVGGTGVGGTSVAGAGVGGEVAGTAVDASGTLPASQPASKTTHAHTTITRPSMAASIVQDRCR